MNIDIEAENEKAYDPENRCGGMHVCKDRSFDTSKPECQECLDDATKAMEYNGCESWD